MKEQELSPRLQPGLVVSVFGSQRRQPGKEISSHSAQSQKRIHAQWKLDSDSAAITTAQTAATEVLDGKKRRNKIRDSCSLSLSANLSSRLGKKLAIHT